MIRFQLRAEAGNRPPNSVAILVCLLLVSGASALEPKEIAILVNRRLGSSREVAEHYAARRGVPKENIVALHLPTGEDISRKDFDREVVPGLREALAGRKATIKCLLCVYGVPLRVGGIEPGEDEKNQLNELKPKLEAARKSLAELEKADKKDRLEIAAARAGIRSLETKQSVLQHRESHAAFDSELMLLWQKPYPLERWQPNPLHWQFPAATRAKLPEPVLMTCRLDGPTPEIARRLVDDAIAVEADGLKGKVYIDARGIGFNSKKPGDAQGYGGYDESYREMAALLRSAKFDVTLDDRNDLFQPASCPDAAIYSGWYSHANYIPCCTFAKGAIAWHLASSEAVTLRNDQSKVWCPNLLKAGVAATLGPVAEPYTIGFPKPSEFFGFVATGRYPLAECYARTIAFTSWMTVLVGDPLYNPFKSKPRLEESLIVPSPKGGPALFR